MTYIPLSFNALTTSPSASLFPPPSFASNTSSSAICRKYRSIRHSFRGAGPHVASLKIPIDGRAPPMALNSGRYTISFPCPYPRPICTIFENNARLFAKETLFVPRAHLSIRFRCEGNMVVEGSMKGAYMAIMGISSSITTTMITKGINLCILSTKLAQILFLVLLDKDVLQRILFICPYEPVFCPRYRFPAFFYS